MMGWVDRLLHFRRRDSRPHPICSFTCAAVWSRINFQSISPTQIVSSVEYQTVARHPTFLGDVRKLVKTPKSMGFPVDAAHLEN
jgi:hypothetical protein